MSGKRTNIRRTVIWYINKKTQQVPRFVFTSFLVRSLSTPVWPYYSPGLHIFWFYSILCISQNIWCFAVYFYFTKMYVDLVLYINDSFTYWQFVCKHYNISVVPVKLLKETHFTICYPSYLTPKLIDGWWYKNGHFTSKRMIKNIVFQN